METNIKLIIGIIGIAALLIASFFIGQASVTGQWWGGGPSSVAIKASSADDTKCCGGTKGCDQFDSKSDCEDYVGCKWSCDDKK